MDKEELLFKQSRKLNDAVARQIYDEYFALLFAVCRRYAPDADAAKDILQDSFIKIFENIKKFEWKGKGSFIGWMRRIVMNTAIKQYHKKKKDATDSMNNLDFEPHDTSHIDDSSFIELLLDAQVTESHLLQLLTQIPEHFRIVFNLYAIEGLSHKEIADLLQIPEKTSTTRLTRARKQLREIILEHYAPHYANPLREDRK